MGKVTRVPPGTLKRILTGRGALFVIRPRAIKPPIDASTAPDEPYDPAWVEHNRRMCDAALESIRKEIEDGTYPSGRKAAK